MVGIQDLKNAIKQEPINIVTHNDPDGLLAAAICTRGLNALGADDIDYVFESPSTIQQKKSRFLDPESDDFIGGFIIILDLPYHELARIWIDHHASELDAKPAPGTLIVVQDTSKCAATLVYDFFKNQLGVKEKLCDPGFLEYVEARDIGRALKINVKDYEVFSLAILEDRDDYNFFFDIIDVLVEDLNPKRLAQDAKVMLKAKKQKKQINKGIELLHNMSVATERDEYFHQIDKESDKAVDDASKKRVFFYKKCLFFDFSDLDNPNKEREYGAVIPYYIIEPELQKQNVQYSFLLVYRGDEKTGEIHCTISINQANADLVKNFDVSEFAKQKGGGGHRFVSGFSISPEQFLPTISHLLDFFKVE
nr:hypothetical protein [Candidatus Sigynarchaeota archaeon]